MTDIEGRNWWELAVASATGSGAKNFTIVYPHPKTGQAATGYHHSLCRSGIRRSEGKRAGYLLFF
jgi:hypothetical protein